MLIGFKRTNQPFSISFLLLFIKVIQNRQKKTLFCCFLSYGLNKEKEIKMRIQELLDDDQLYEIWLLLSDAIWEALVDNYSSIDVAEGFKNRRPVSRRRAVMPTRSRPARTIKG